MKIYILALLTALSMTAFAEDSVICDDHNEANLALTDDGTINIDSVGPNQQVLRVQILVHGQTKYQTIENNKTKVGNLRIDKVKATVDNGTSIQRLIIYDITNFEDGAEIPVEIYEHSPGGTKLIKTIMCYGAQS